MAGETILGVLTASALMAAPRLPALPPASSIAVSDFLPLTSTVAVSAAQRGAHTRVLYEWATIEPDWGMVQAMLWPSIAPTINMKGLPR